MRQTVDGFTPRNQPQKPLPIRRPDLTRPLPPVVIKKPGHAYKGPVQAPKPVDGVVVVHKPAQTHIAQTAAAVPPIHTVRHDRPRLSNDRPEFIKERATENKLVKKRSKFRKFLSLAQYPLSAIVLGVAIYSTTVGQWIILAYAIYAIVKGVKSQNTFVAALILLIAIPLFQLLNQPGVAEVIAMYAYELLVVGTLQAIIEVVKDSRRRSRMV